MAPSHPVHGPYHDAEYGFPATDERVLFERLLLEINQAGLSWLTILNKRAAFRAAFADFEVDRVAAFGPVDIDRLLADPGIVRNRLKIAAAIENAQRIRALRDIVRIVHRLARRAPPALGRSVDAAVPQDLPLHRRADRRRVLAEPRLSARAHMSRIARSLPALPNCRRLGHAPARDEVPAPRAKACLTAMAVLCYRDGRRLFRRGERRILIAHPGPMRGSACSMRLSGSTSIVDHEVA